MNLSEALDAALPEIPRTRLARGRPPCLDPDLVVREDLLDGEIYFVALKRDGGSIFRFTPLQWQAVVLFDGVRTFDEIAELRTEQTGAPLSGDEVRAFADAMERDGFWYKTPQEKNLALSQKLMDQRGRRAGHYSGAAHPPRLRPGQHGHRQLELAERQALPVSGRDLCLQYQAPAFGQPDQWKLHLLRHLHHAHSGGEDRGRRVQHRQPDFVRTVPE